MGCRPVNGSTTRRVDRKAEIPAMSKRQIDAVVWPAGHDQPTDVALVGCTPGLLYGRHIHSGVEGALGPGDDVDAQRTRTGLDDLDGILDLFCPKVAVPVLVWKSDSEDFKAACGERLHETGCGTARLTATVGARVIWIGPSQIRILICAVHQQNGCGFWIGIPIGRVIQQKARGIRGRNAVEERDALSGLIAAAVRWKGFLRERCTGITPALHLRPAVGDRSGVSSLEYWRGGVRGDRHSPQEGPGEE